MTRIQLGTDCHIDDGATLGHAYEIHGEPTKIGDRATIRSGTVIYAATDLGHDLNTGHNALVREGTTIGDEVLVGTGATIDGQSTIGSNVSLQTGAYVPTNSTIGDHVFLGPYAVLTNDRYPVRSTNSDELLGPTINDGATVGANATVLPDIEVGENAFIAAGSVVTEDVPPSMLAMGIPATHRELPLVLEGGNRIG